MSCLVTELSSAYALDWIAHSGTSLCSSGQASESDPRCSSNPATAQALSTSKPHTHPDHPQP
jgi:hypothetical protein